MINVRVENMMRNRIVLIDSFAIYGFHEIFDAAILIEASRTYREVIYYGTKSSISNLQNNIRNSKVDNVSYRFLPQLTGTAIVSLFWRYVLSAVLTIGVLIRNKKENIVILNNNPFLSCFYCMIPQRVTIFCHGEIELLETTHMGKFARLQSKLLKRAFLKRQLRSNLRFVVLGDSILNNLNHILPDKNFGLFSSMDHPYLFNNTFPVSSDSTRDVVRIGIVGITTPTKGLTELVNLLNTPCSHVQFYHIGKINDEDGSLRSKGLIIVKRDNSGNLSREEYIKWIGEMDYLLYLYSSDSYRLTASGAIFEAFSNLKPIISLSNDYFNYIIKKTGDIGYVFGGVEAMGSFIKSYSFDKAAYERHKNNLKRGRLLFTVDSQTEKFRKLTSWEDN